MWAPPGRYIPKPPDHQFCKGNPSCQSLISLWSKFVFYKTFPSTLAYVILRARGSPFSIIHLSLFPYPNSIFYFVLVPHCLIAICIVLTQAIGLFCCCFSFCWCHRLWLRPIRCWCLCNRVTCRCSPTTVCEFRRSLLRRRHPPRSYCIRQCRFHIAAIVLTKSEGLCVGTPSGVSF